MQLLLSTTTIGDRKPSEFLQHLRTLIGEKQEHDSPIIKQLFMDHLPSEIKPIVAATKSDKLDDLAETADRVHNITRTRSTKHISSIHDTTHEHKYAQATEIASLHPEFNDELHKLQIAAAKTSAQVKTMETSFTMLSEAIQSLRLEVQRNSYNTQYQQQQEPYYQPRGRSTSRGPSNNHWRSDTASPASRKPPHYTPQTSHQHSTPPQHQHAANLCWYHTSYGALARSCNAPCAWNKENSNAAQR
jgi:hypothetical protein